MPMPEPPEPPEPATDLEIVPLTPDRLPDLATLFDAGGDPKRCWCSFFHTRGSGYEDLDQPGANRAAMEARAEGPRPPGLIAYRDGEPVGWVSVEPRAAYERLAHSVVLRPIDDRPAWSVVCFVVARRARKAGVARALLDAAVGFVRANGGTLVEAYPVDAAAGRVSAAAAYKGTLAMFVDAGFEVAERRQFNRASPVRPIVRLELVEPASDAEAG